MKSPFAIYIINEFIDAEFHALFKVLKQYYEYGIDYDYTIKFNECQLQLTKELSTDPEMIKALKQYNFVKVK